MTQLTELLLKYREREGYRARGGVYALAGFELQIHAFLLDFFRALTRSRLDASPPESQSELLGAFEALSDHTRAPTGQGEVVCVQVKRTLTRSTLRKCIEEAISIERFLKEELGSTEIAYEIVTKRIRGRPSIEDLHLSNPADQEVFERLRLQRAFLPFRTLADPRPQLLAEIFPYVSRPIEFLNEAASTCLRRGLNPEGSEDVRDSLVRLFDRHWQLPTLPRVKLLTEEDVRRGQSSTGRIQVGRTPIFTDIRNGNFMPREDLVASAIGELDAAAAKEIDDGLNIFWITGKSGSGKSVILLQIVQQLVEAGESVFWLDQPEELMSILSEWPQVTRLIGQPIFVAVDDIYDPQSRETLDLEKLTSLVTSNREEEWPILLTCGPPDFEQAFRSDSVEGLHVYNWRLPAVERAEIEKLEAWYRLRTGKSPLQGLAARQALDHNQGLMVSIMYEFTSLQENDQSSLARVGDNFKKRLEAAGLAETLRLPLAVHRLYVWPPQRWLEDDHIEELEQLNAQEDFILSPESRDGRLRLTHPHLADTLYRALSGRILRPRKEARILAGAFKRALDENDDALSLGLLKIFAGGSERLSICDEEVLYVEALKAWTDVGPKRGEQSSIWNWISWIRWEERHPRLAAKPQRESMFLQCLASLKLKDQKDWYSAWLFLCEWFPNYVQLIGLGLRQLENSQAQEKRSKPWLAIWRKLVECRVHNYQPIVQHIGLTWLGENQDHRRWPLVLNLLARHSSSPDVRGHMEQIGLSWLADNEFSIRWLRAWLYIANLSTRVFSHKYKAADIWEYLLPSPGWLSRALWGPLWRTFLDNFKLVQKIAPKAERSEFLDRGRAWLQSPGVTRNREAAEVAIGILSSLGGSELVPVLRVSEEWLMESCNHSRPTWVRLFELYLDAGGSRKQLLECSSHWCMRNRSHYYTPLVAAKVLCRAEAGTGIERLAKWMAEWLRANRQKPIWRRVYHTLKEAADSEEFHLRESELGALLGEQDREVGRHWHDLETAYREQTPVAGKIQRLTPSGFEVNLGSPGKFTVNSRQIDLGVCAFPEAWLGVETRFLVTRIDREALTATLSRKAWVKKLVSSQSQATLESLVPGKRCSGSAVHAFDGGLLVEIDGLYARLDAPRHLRPGVGEKCLTWVKRIDPAYRCVWLSLEPVPFPKDLSWEQRFKLTIENSRQRLREFIRS